LVRISLGQRRGLRVGLPLQFGRPPLVVGSLAGELPLALVVAPALLGGLACLFLLLLPLRIVRGLPLPGQVRFPVALPLLVRPAGLLLLLPLPLGGGLPLSLLVGFQIPLTLLVRLAGLILLLPLPLGGGLPLSLLVRLQVPLTLLVSPAVFLVPAALPLLGRLPLPPLVGVDLALPLLGRPALPLGPVSFLVTAKGGRLQEQGQTSGHGERPSGQTGEFEHG